MLRSPNLQMLLTLALVAALFAIDIPAQAASTTLAGMSPSVAYDESEGGRFVAAQGRAFDSRSEGGALQANQWREIQVAGRAGVPTTDVTAVSVSLETINPTGPGLVQISSLSIPQANDVSYLNYSGPLSTNTVVVKLTSSGTIHVRTTSTTHLIIDSQGYYTSETGTASGFVPINPQRAVDTRVGLGTPTSGSTAKLAAGSTTSFSLTNYVPANASAAFVNFTVVTPNQASIMTAYAEGEQVPGTSLSFGSQTATSIGSIVSLRSSTRSFSVVIQTGAHLVVDVLGYYAPSTANGRLVVSQQRVHDTRVAPTSTLASNQSMTISLTSKAQVPAGIATSAALHVAVVSRSSAGYLSMWKAGTSEPQTSAVSYSANSISSNLVVTGVSESDAAVTIRNRGESPVDVIVDLEGWFSRALAAPTGVSGVGSLGLMATVPSTYPDDVSVQFRVYDGATLKATVISAQTTPGADVLAGIGSSTIVPGRVYTLLARTYLHRPMSDWSPGVFDTRDLTTAPAPPCAQPCHSVAPVPILSAGSSLSPGETLEANLPATTSERSYVHLNLHLSTGSAGSLSAIDPARQDRPEGRIVVPAGASSTTARVSVGPSNSVVFTNHSTGSINITAQMIAASESDEEDGFINPLMEVPGDSNGLVVWDSPTVLNHIELMRTEMKSTYANVAPGTSTDVEQQIEAAGNTAVDRWEADVQAAQLNADGSKRERQEGNCGWNEIDLGNAVGNNIGYVRARFLVKGGSTAIYDYGYKVWDTATWDFSEWRFSNAGAKKGSAYPGIIFGDSRTIDVGENGYYGARITSAYALVAAGLKTKVCFALWGASVDNVRIQ